MRIKGLFKAAVAMALAVTLCFESSVAYAAEDSSVFEESISQEYDFEIEDVSEELDEDFDYSEDAEEESSEEIEEPSEDIAEEYPDIVSDEESEEASDEVSEDYSNEDVINEITEEADGFTEEDPDEILINDDEENSFDVSANDEGNVDSSEVTMNGAASTNPVKNITIYSNIERASAEASKYSVQYNGDGSMKKAVFTLDSKYISMKLTAVQTDKNKNTVNLAPVWKSNKENVVSVSGNGLTATIKAVSAGTAKITCYAGDGSKKKKTVKIQVKQAVTGIDIEGYSYAVIGKKNKYTAKITPKDATNKDIEWSLNKKIEGVTIKDGKLKVAKDVEAGQKVKIIASSKDSGKIYSEKEVRINGEVKSVTITPSSETTIATHAIGELKTTLGLEAATDNDEIIKWSFENKGIAEISIAGNKATIKAKKPGKLKATATATDGSKKKACIEVNIITPPSSLSLTVPSTRLKDYVAKGCSLKFTPSFGDKYGKPTVTDLKWDYEVVGFDWKQKDKKIISANIQKKIKDNKYFFTLEDGMVKIADTADYDARAKELYDDCKCDNYAIVVKATTTDESNISAQQLVKVVDRNTYMKVEPDEWTVAVGGTNIGSVLINTQYGSKGLYFTYSKKGIARIGVAEGSSYAIIYGLKAGTTKATIHAMDGTGLTKTITIKVHN